MMICVNFLLLLNAFHNNFQEIHFHEYRKLLQEDTDTFIQKIPDYLVKTQNMYMFVRVERPKGSRRFVLRYVKCDWVFSFAKRFEQIRLLLNRVPPRVLTKVEVGENKALRLACVGETDYERALTTYCDGYGQPPLNAALEKKDEDAVEVLLDGGVSPNQFNLSGRNALHIAARTGCSLPLFHRILGMIHNVNAGATGRITALMIAVTKNSIEWKMNHLDMVVSLMNHPSIDVNVQNSYTNKNTALHYAVEDNCPAIVAQLLSDDRVDTSLKDSDKRTPLMLAIEMGRDECAKFLREHGAPEE